MKKMRNEKFLRYDQTSAIKELEKISQGETGFIEDWSNINSIKYDQIQIMNYSRYNDPIDNYCEFNEDDDDRLAPIQDVNNNCIQPRKTNVNFRMRQKQIKVKNQSIQCKKQNKIFGHKYKDFPNLSQKRLLIGKPIQVPCLQNNQCSSTKRDSSQISSTKKHKRSRTQVPQQTQTFNRKNQKSPQNKYKYLINLSPFKYLLKLKNQSLSALKYDLQQKPMVIQYPKSQDDQFNKQKDREVSRRLNQIIKNKIRRKRTNKFIIQRQLNQSLNLQNKKQEKQKSRYIQFSSNSVANINFSTITSSFNQPLKNPKNMIQLKTSTNLYRTKSKLKQNSQKPKAKGSIQQVKSQRQRQDLRILKNWIDSSRYIKKRSVGSLLNEHVHMQSKSFQKQRERQRQKQRQNVMRSVKFITMLTQQNINKSQ